MKINIIIIVSYFLITPSFSQTFSGRLIYKTIDNDSMRMKEKFRLISFEEQIDYAITRTIWVKKDFLRQETTNNYGKTKWVEYQNSKTAYINMSKDYNDSIVYYRIPYDNTITEKKLTFKSINKTENYRSILGWACKEYIYTYEGGVVNIVEKVWIPDSFKLKKPYSYGKFFLHYFYPDGLAFLRERYINGILNSSSELINIQIYDVPNDQFEDCEVPKKD
jgi:hypothetical protein